MIRCLSTGLVYSNPTPHLRAIHAWHPCVIDLGAGKMLCTFDLGQAAESLDYSTYIASSADAGQTWSEPRRLIAEEHLQGRPSTHTIRTARLPSGKLLGMGARFYRDDPTRGLTNRANLGMTPMDVVSVTSDDDGQTWSPPTTVEAPTPGPAFETCHAPKPIAAGICLYPTQTWPDWDGSTGDDMCAIAFVSRDEGKTWPDCITVFDGRQQRVAHFEQSITQLADGRLLAVAWAYERDAGKTLPTPYSIASDCADFPAARPTGLLAQTAKLLTLSDGRVLCVYRGHGRPGLWAQLVRIDGERWINLDEQLLWAGQSYGAPEPNDTSDKLSALKFGFPSLTQLSDGSVQIVFWCVEDSLHRIRWFNLKIDDAAVQGDGSVSPHFSRSSDRKTDDRVRAEQ